MNNPASMLFVRTNGEASFEWSTKHGETPVARSLRGMKAVEPDWHEVLLKYDSVVDPAPKVPQSGYHAATSDHPFLDMSRGVEARVEDARLMAGYASAGDYPAVALDMAHTSEVDVEDAADLTLDELRTSDVHRLTAIISGTFGIRRHQPAYHDKLTGYHQVELVRKSVPSGGSRHPTEFFLEVLRSPLLQEGVWHYNAKRRQLHLVDEKADEVFQSDADWVMRTHMVSAVRRAMFRYRDPRSFRAILVDAGHADAQFEMLAKFCNWRYRSTTNVNFEFARRVRLQSEEYPELISGTLEGWR